MSSLSDRFDGFVSWALETGRDLSKLPARCTTSTSGIQLSLYDDAFCFGFSWADADNGVGLTGANADKALTVSAVAPLADKSEAMQFQDAQDFENAATFVLEMLIAQDWVMPGIGNWAHKAWSIREGTTPTSAVRQRLNRDVVSVLEQETPKRLLTERVLATLLDHEDLAALLAFLAPRLVLEDQAATLSILRQPELASCALWKDVPYSERELLPWVVHHWAADNSLGFEHVLKRMGIDDQLRKGLSQMHPGYLHRLAEPLLHFNEPDLVCAFWNIAGDTVLRDCMQSARPDQVPPLRPTVSQTQIDMAWGAWAKSDPDMAASFSRQRPRAVV